MSIDAVIFDCWGTLISYSVQGKGFIGARLLELTDHPRGMTPLQAEKTWHDMMINYYADEKNVTFNHESTAASLLLAACIRSGLKPKIPLDELVERTIGAQYTQQAIPGINLMLDFLRKKGIPFAVASNTIYTGEQTRRYVAQCVDIRDSKFVIASSEIGVKKPNPYFFDIAAKLMGVSANQCCYIGDDLKKDIEGSHAAGYGLSIWLNSELPVPGNMSFPVVRAKSYQEAIEILEDRIG